MRRAAASCHHLILVRITSARVAHGGLTQFAEIGEDRRDAGELGSYRFHHWPTHDVVWSDTSGGDIQMMKIYIDTNDWWVGYYRGEHYHFVCPLPTLVIRWSRR